jgi:hypothetical protein
VQRNTCPYRLSVVVMLECPSRSCTRFACAPAAISSVARVCPQVLAACGRVADRCPAVEVRAASRAGRRGDMAHDRQGHAPSMPRWTVRLPENTSAPRVAREAIDKWLPELAPGVRRDARSIVSELVANAVR